MKPGGRNAAGAACIGAAAVFYSLIPLPIRYAGEGFSVLVLGTLMESACATMLLAALAVSSKAALGVGPLRAMRPARLVALPPAGPAGPRPALLLAFLLVTAPNVLLYAGTAALLPLVVLSCFSDGLDVVPQSLLIARWSGSSRSISSRSAVMMCGLPVAVLAVVWSQTAPGQIDGGSWRETAVGLVLGVLTTATYAIRPSAGIIYGDRCALARRSGETAASVKDYGVALWWSTFAASAVSAPIVAVVALMLAFGGLGTTRSAAYGAVAGLIMGCARLMHRAGNIVTADTRVNSLLYASPAMAAIWLTIAGDPIYQPVLFGAGMAVIAVLNAAIAADRGDPQPVTPQ
ncbi:MAG: hypothetical protein F4Z00_02055 [Acidimicrobiaceae bacterium]|nr:hypothetical protein [Acidimicrobiaceae bacterium]MDE0666394.1 hypothetical protein [Acidimicrobiaceae bacterium]MXY10091.1 hypothetical protein [Acidimicrobiaceae bacterium]MXZ64320.1 hypothetical protein [Acidimicrobiaceae bacterium]MYF33356.1 hypothetical protein [Acidimicrobiaceae bacterium]